ncbi:gliding motility-associated C-terminal domain-containing protein [Xanthomarina sp. F2636L]|uniref:T9SS type B sorting domain-containing protein n=1 Tax=Xanthomarina sp. F2636L TaxID=2996018 RepID=UPI00225E10DC|nr:gliding motility-associated C-terminal domain-containing protein [Xanthomarina sp. F2636L]MCX7551040.1 gliding motility-associated C-terminal domain-containing protein [Xanthomarina sp. F2636L]
MKKITLSLLFGFISLIGFSQIGLVENFDAGLTLPPGWTGTGYSGTPFNPCSVVSLRANLSASNLTDDLISPNIVGESNGTDLTVAFDYKIVDWSAAVDPTPPGWGQFNVQYSTNDGATWISIGTIDDINHQTANTCANVSYVIPAADVPIGTNVKLRFENIYFSGNYYFYIDNVTATQVVVDPPSCSPLINPTNGATGVAITENLSWQPATGIPSGYTLSVGTSPGGTELVDNVNTGLSTTYDLPDLEYSTTYYVNIIPFNDNGPAVNCPEQTFTTGADPNAPVDCSSGIPINTVFCYTNNDTTTFSFQSSDGSPLVVVFNSGSTENNYDELIILDSDGTTNLNNATPYGAAGNLAGLMFISSGDTITVGVTSDGSGISCTSNPWDFDVYCLDTTALPNCDSVLTTPTNGATDVDVATQITWTQASVFVTGYFVSIGTTPGGTDIANNVDVGDVLTYTPATILPYETVIYVTITPYNDNGSAENCIENSFETKLNPYQCPAEDQCVFTFTLEDSWGDGWGGNTMTVSQDGLEIEILELTGGSGPVEVNIPLCDGIPFELFWNNGGSFANEVMIFVTDAFGDVIYTLPAGSGGLRGTLLFSDMVNCTPPTCPRPSDVTVGEINMTDVEISWTETGAATTWEVIVQPLGTGYPDGTEPEIIQTTDNPYLYEGLDAATQYEIYVRAVCAADDLSDWEGPVAFDTTICDAVDQCNFTFILEDSWGDGWGGNTMTVSQNGIDLQTLTLLTGSGPLEIQVPLCDGVPFELFWNNGGSFASEVMISVTDAFDDVIYTMPAGSASLQGTQIFSGIVNCTPPTCPRPDDITIVDVNPTSVEVSWTPGGAETTWEVIVQPIGSGYPDGTEPEIIQTTDNPYLYEGLTPGTEYEIYVRGICAADDLSDWEGPVTFKTQISVDCAAGQVINTTYCYPNGTNGVYVEIFSFQGSGGFPLNILFNSGEIENCCDTIRILDGDGNIIYEGTNGGDLTGFALTTPGDSFTILLESDGSFSCESGSRDIWDFDVWCQTCIPQTASFDVINGDCITDPDNPVFEIQVDISDMGDATTLDITDNQGSAPQTATETGTLVFGPYAANTNVIITVANADDANCIIESNPLAFLCPPPPNPCSIAYAGEDTSVDCNTPDALLSANFHLYGQDTENYDINAIDTCPSPPVDGATPTSINIDDRWSEVLDLGFDFCFYGGVYNQVIIGSNGVVSFETQHAGTYNEWDLQPFGGGPSTLPNTTNTTITEANIFGVGHDIDPSVCGSIDYVVLGSAPYRQFVVNYNAVCHFGSSCNSNTSTSQIVLHESSNNIDIHVISKPTCTSWNDGLAVIGVQSVDDSQATTPPGRNTGVWTVTEEESWRFSPSGTPNYTLQWLDEEGTVLGTEETVTVSPTQTTNYTFEVTYELCTGGTATVSDIVEVEYINLSTYDGSFEITASCDGATSVILGDTGGTFAFSPEPGDGAVIDEATGEITNGVPGTTYTVQYTVGEVSCPAIVTESVTIPLSDASFTLIANCDGAIANITGTTGGTFSFNPEPGDGANIDPVTGEITNGIVGTTYTVEYATPEPCSTSSTQTVTVLGVDDASFTLTANCTGATATITGNTGGTFTFNPVPTDGATIDPTTGEITNGVTGATYTVEYTTISDCPSTTTETITIPDVDDASFTITSTCDGGTVVITGDTGGTFAFNPVPTDGATIDPATGDIINGVSGTTYTVEYTTSGTCPASSTETVTVLNAEDASFTITPSCTGATVIITGDLGGTFTFNPEPGDGAIIDSATGEITNGISGASYTVEYTTGGDCPETSSQTVTLIPGGNAAFTLTANCFGATATITGDTGGTFAFDPVPSDGATIDPTTGTIINGVSGATYTVTYTTAGTCVITSTETVTVLDAEDATFTMTATCDGGTATVTGDAGGVFYFNPIPSDGATIDPATGEVTNGTEGMTYYIEYETPGPCYAISVQTVTVLNNDTEVLFNVTPTCDGATVEIISGDVTGGSFALNPEPLGGAVIDPLTGEVTGGASNTNYTIEFTTGGDCPVITSETFTTDTCVIPQVITPNGDGFNDSFDLSGFDVSSLEIFNRNGIKVYSRTNGYTKEFEGISDNGNELPTGTYFYVMRYKGSEVKSAWLYINREK